MVLRGRDAAVGGQDHERLAPEHSHDIARPDLRPCAAVHREAHPIVVTQNGQGAGRGPERKHLPDA